MADLNIYFDGVAIPAPTKFNVTGSDLSKDSYRDELAEVHFKILRKDVRKLEFGWDNISSSDASFILNLRTPQFISISYPNDPITNRRNEVTVYTGDWSCDIDYVYDNAKSLYKSLSFNAIGK